jgi:beta-glucanase (GH16 family)
MKTLVAAISAAMVILAGCTATVPSSVRGALVLSLTGAQVMSDFAREQNGGTYCQPATGTYSTDGSDGVLTTNGTVASCAEVVSRSHYTYGVFQSKVYLPDDGTGKIANWPAFWMTSAGLPGESWPADGEFDIMEGMSGEQCVHFHYGADNTQPGWCQGPMTGWHTFTGVWGPGFIAVYIDGVLRAQWSSTNVTSKPMRILFDNTTGSWSSTTGKPSAFKIASLKVWAWNYGAHYRVGCAWVTGTGGPCAIVQRHSRGH